MPDNNVDASVLLPILKQIPLFANLDESLHEHLIEGITLMYYPANYVIFNEGDPGDALYIVKKGIVEIFHPPKEEGDLPKKVADIGIGGFFGEMALISEEARNASAKASEDVEAFILSKANFQKLLDSEPHLAQSVSAAVVERMKQNQQNQN